MAIYFGSELSPTVGSPRVSEQILGGQCLTQPYAPRPAFLLHLAKENAHHHASSLVENFMVQLTLQGLLGM